MCDFRCRVRPKLWTLVERIPTVTPNPICVESPRPIQALARLLGFGWVARRLVWTDWKWQDAGVVEES